MNDTFKLSNEKKDEMLELIQTYFKEEQDEEIGNLKAMLFLDFIMEKLAPEFYNLGIEASHHYMTDKIADIFEIQK